MSTSVSVKTTAKPKLVHLAPVPEQLNRLKQEAAERAAKVAKSNSQLDFTKTEAVVANAAYEGLMALKRTFEHWVAVGKGLAMLRAKADRIGGKFTFDKLREQAGLGPTQLDKSAVSKLLKIIEDLPEVEKWRKTLTEKERFEWCSPAAIFKHCPRYKPVRDPKEPKKVSPVAKLQAANNELADELAVAKEELAAAALPFDLDKSTPEQIAAAIAAAVPPAKLKALAEALQKAATKPAAKPVKAAAAAKKPVAKSAVKLKVAK